jgi:hypothetical protein
MTNAWAIGRAEKPVLLAKGQKRRLSDPGWHLHTRLYPRQRSRSGDLEALRYLRSSGRSMTLNCGYGHGFSVREVLDTVKQVSHVDFQQMMQVGHIRLH